VAAYRFCRTDDIGLLVDALNQCWVPQFPGEALVTPETFKRSIRDLQVWCSSCMVAFANGEPIGVLIGAKRSGATLVHRIAVRPDHQRQGHGRHMLGSLGSKLAILGPRRMVAEIPESYAAACELFSVSGYVENARLTDYVLDGEPEGSSPELGVGRFIIPVTVDDLVANGLLDGADPATCWQRSAETLTARKADIGGFAVATDERLEACILYSMDGDVLLLRSFFDDGGVRVKALVSRLRACGLATPRFQRVSADEIAAEWLQAAGFRAGGASGLYAADARGD
jgi:GNAT superfamily N-acetyltransferase